jgi:hypothetical protein
LKIANKRLIVLVLALVLSLVMALILAIVIIVALIIVLVIIITLIIKVHLASLLEHFQQISQVIILLALDKSLTLFMFYFIQNNCSNLSPLKNFKNPLQFLLIISPT